MLVGLSVTGQSLGQSVTVGAGATTSRFPVSFFYGYGMYSMIYTSAELGTTVNGIKITQLGFETSLASGYFNGPIKIYLKTTASTAQSVMTWAAKTTGATVVYNGQSNFATLGFNLIDINDYILPPGQNLEVMVECTWGMTGNGSGTTQNALLTTVVTNGIGVWETDTAPSTGNCTTTNERPNIRINYQVLPAGPAISYNPLPNMGIAGSATLSNVTIYDADGVNGTIGTRPRVYYKRTTDANTFNSNTSATAGWKWVEALGAASPFTFSINHSLLQGGGVTLGDTIQYFVIAQDLLGSPNVSQEAATLSTAPSSVDLSAANFPATSVTNSYQIFQSFCNGTGGTIPDNNTATNFPVVVTGGPSSLGAANGLVEVEVNISHTYNSDLKIELQAPDGTKIVLSNLNGGANDNYIGTRFTQSVTQTIKMGVSPFTGSFQPEESLGGLNNGQSANGTWNLVVTDVSGTIGGSVNSFCLYFGPGAEVAPATPTNFTPCTATLVPVGTSCRYKGYRLDQTNNSGVPSPDCVSFVGGDVWFKMAVPATGALRIDTKAGTITDMEMVAYKRGATCGSLTLLTCEDGGGSTPNMPMFEFYGLTPGDTLYIRLFSWLNMYGGTFELCASQLSCPGGGLSGVYTIPGSYATLQAAVTDAMTKGLCGATTFRIADATYNLGTPITIGIIPGTSETSRLTIESASGNAAGVVYTFAGGTVPNYTIGIAGADYVTIRKITISRTGAGATNFTALELSNGAHHNNIDTCVLNSIVTTAVADNMSVVTAGLDKPCNYLNFRGCTVNNGSIGLNADWNPLSGYAEYLFASNNTFTNQYFYALYSYNCYAPKIRYNTIVSNAVGALGIGLEEGYYGKIEYNSIQHSNTQINGIYLGGHDGSISYRVKVANNVIGGKGDSRSIEISASYVDVIHNTVLNSAGSSNNTTAGIAATTYWATPSDIRVFNNISRVLTAGTAISEAATGQITASDFNVFSVTSTRFGRSGGLVNTLAVWQTTTGKDFQTLSVDPTFVSIAYPYNLHVSNVAINNLGVPMGYLKDMDNQDRSTSRPDPGADEFNTGCVHTTGIVYVRAGASGANNGSSWANAYTDLNVALTNTCRGAEIWVAAGTYKPTVAINRNKSFILPDGVAIYGGFAGTETARTQRNVTANVTILSGDQGSNSPGTVTDDQYHVVGVFGTSAGTVLDGFTIQHANANIVAAPTGGRDLGGGIYMLGGQLLLENNTFNACRAGSGGGVLASSGAKMTINKCTFQGNITSSEGGGIFAIEGAKVSISNSTFTNNSSTTNGGAIRSNSLAAVSIFKSNFLNNISQRGGAFYMFDCENNTVDSCNFESNGNATTIAGGALYTGFNDPPSTSLTITNSVFVNNQATEGGVATFGGDKIVIKNSRFWGNRSTSTSTTYGGGCFDNGSKSLTLVNCLFHDNWANMHGGVLEQYNWGGTFSHTTDIINCTFFRNKADNDNNGTGGGGAIYQRNAGPIINLRNCLIVGNTSPVGPDINGVSSPVTSVGYNLIGNTASANLNGNTATNLPPGTSAYFIDVDGPDNIPGNVDDNFGVMAYSPVINSGDPATPLSVIGENDVRGDNRLQQSLIDIGSFEQYGCAGLAGTYVIDNGGTGNFLNLTAAVSELVTCGVSGPVTLSYKPGSGPYVEQVSIPQIFGMDNVDTLLIHGNNVVMEFDPPTATRYVLDINGGRNITVRKLNIDAYGTGFGYGIQLRNQARKVRIDSCVVLSDSITGSANYACIVSSNVTNNLFGNGYNADSITVSNNELVGGYAAVYLNNNTGTPSRACVISKNKIRKISNAGITLSYADYAKVLGNTISARTGATTADGISVNVIENGITIANNSINNVGDMGILVTNTGNGSAARSVVYNNMVGGTFLSSAAADGIRVNASTRVDVFFNSVWVNNGTSAAMYQTNSCVDINIRNNTLAHTSGLGFAFNTQDYLDLTTLNYNNYYVANGSVLAFYNGANQTTLANLQAQPGPAAHDMNSLTVDPRHKSVANLHVKPASTLLGAGQTVAGLTTDIDGQTRAGSPTIGADEFICTPQRIYVRGAATGANDGTSWTNAYKELTDALDVTCGIADTIWVAAGAYKPDWNGTTHDLDRNRSFIINNNLVMLGGFVGSETAPEPRDPVMNLCILTGDLSNNDVGFTNNTENSYHILRATNVTAGTGSLIDGFTIRNGNANGGVTADQQGAAMLMSNSKIAFKSCVIVNNNGIVNLASNGGGAISANTTCTLTMTDCQVNNNRNTGARGGAVSVQSGSATLRRCTFTGNQTPGGHGGAVRLALGGPFVVDSCTFDNNTVNTATAGALYMEGATMTVNKCTFTNNTSSASWGGAIAAINNGTLNLKNSTFFNNTGNLGGAVNGDNNVAINAFNCYFIANNATTSGTSRGGAIFLNTTPATSVIANCVFSGNRAFGGGGAVYNGTGTTKLINNTLVFNVANQDNLGTETGGGVLQAGGTVTLHNNILWDNDNQPGNGVLQSSEYSGTFTMQNNLVQNGAVVSGNINTPPMFVKPRGIDNLAGTMDDNLRLRGGSPARNYGISANLPNDLADLDKDANTAEQLPIDLDSVTRIQSTSVDLGAYEFMCTPRRLYVDASAGGNNDGSSWTHAFTELQDALSMTCGSADTIWVADGTYKPDWDGIAHILDRNASFKLGPNLVMFGGFAGGETDTTTRDPQANICTLSGDLNGNDNANIIHTEATRSDNVYHVVEVTGNPAPSRMDGFRVTGGNANSATTFRRFGGAMQVDGAPFVVKDCIFYRNTAINSGGAINVRGAGLLHLSDSKVISNRAQIDGGGIYVEASSQATMVNNVFVNNIAVENGGGVSGFNAGTVINLMNNTFYANRADEAAAFNKYGGGAYLFGAGSMLNSQNNIFWGNLSAGNPDPNSLYLGNGSAISTNDLIEFGCNGSLGTCTNIVTTDPLFVNPNGADAILGTLDDDLSLQGGSPAIDAGDATGAPLYDITGLLRGNCSWDIGAYEVDFASAFPGFDVVWSGCSSNDWFLSANWAGGVVPSAADKVIIPAARPFFPQITGSMAECETIDIDTDGGAYVDVNVDGGGSLQVHTP